MFSGVRVLASIVEAPHGDATHVVWVVVLGALLALARLNGILTLPGV